MMQSALLALLVPMKFTASFFNRNNMANLEIPKINGVDLCLKFHVEGKCKSTCPRAKTHIPLENAILIVLPKFVKAVWDNYKAFKAKYKKNDKPESTEVEGETPP